MSFIMESVMWYDSLYLIVVFYVIAAVGLSVLTYVLVKEIGND